MDKLENRSIIARFIGYPKGSIKYYFYFPQDHNVIVSRNTIFLEKQFIQDGGSERLVELEEKVSEESRAIDPQKFIVHEPVVDVPQPPRRSSRISRPSEKYMGMLTKEVKKIFLMRDRNHYDDPNTFDEAMFDINFEKWLDVIAMGV